LDDLTNPETNSALQVSICLNKFLSLQTIFLLTLINIKVTIESRKRKRQQAKDSEIEKVVQMGFERARGIKVYPHIQDTKCAKFITSCMHI